MKIIECLAGGGYLKFHLVSRGLSYVIGVVSMYLLILFLTAGWSDRFRRIRLLQRPFCSDELWWLLLFRATLELQFTIVGILFYQNF